MNKILQKISTLYYSANNKLIKFVEKHKIKLNSTGVLLLFMGNIFLPSLAYADESSLVVEFEKDPLFSEANFLPGNEISRFVKVTNNTADAKDIIVEAINTSDPDELGDKLEIGIWESGLQVYGTSTLSDFFSEGSIFLSSLAGGETTTQYDFVISFETGADNSYQTKSLGFDVLIGFRGDEGIENIEEESPGGSGGGGGVGGNGPLVIPPGLSILNESETSTDTATTSATISWQTSYKSTSRVVYGTSPGVFDFGNPPDYGYSDSTSEFDTPANPMGVFNHAVELNGLTPGITYYYRSISHASPPTISREHSFTTLGGLALLDENIENKSHDNENIILIQITDENRDINDYPSINTETKKSSKNIEDSSGSLGEKVNTDIDEEVINNQEDKNKQPAGLIFGFLPKSWGIGILVLAILSMLFIALRRFFKTIVPDKSNHTKL